jgi:predicted nucleic acid-binding protein
LKRLVLDASVALAWFVDNPVPDYASRVRQSLIGGTKALVPGLWHLELANGLVVAGRRGTLTIGDLTAALVQLDKLAKHIETDLNTLSARQALDVARSFQLSAYDGTYFETARSQGLPLATLDKALRTAAMKSGLQIFS